MARYVIAALIRLLGCAACVACVTVARAVDIEGIRVEERITLPGSPPLPLVLNGAGVRHKLVFIKLYVGALYLVAKQSSAQDIFKDAGAKRITMVVLADEITATDWVASLNSALAANHRPMELAVIEARLHQLNAMMVSVGVLKKGTMVTLNYQPTTGTQILINDEEKLILNGEDFFHALLRIWIGDKPLDGRLRDAMLGGAAGLKLF